MMDSAMDDGDLARLLRRSIDLLAQVCYQASRLINQCSRGLSIFDSPILCHDAITLHNIWLNFPDSKTSRH
jgi:hypothetical protein